MDRNQKNYELAYLVSPEFSEGDISMYAAKLTALIENAGAMLRRAETPRLRPLAYPVRKQKNAYFGWTTFAASPSSIAALEKKLRTHEGLLRHLVAEEQEVKTPPRPFPVYTRPTAPPPASIRPAPREASIPPEEKLDLEALDKKLEEILGT